MFAFLTHLRAKPGKRDALIAQNRLMQDATAAEPGVPVYIFHTAENSPDDFYFYDLYSSDEAYQAHCASDAFQTMMGCIGELADIVDVIKLQPFGPIKSEPVTQA
jgi:quinol monooxygenase YgiN